MVGGGASAAQLLGEISRVDVDDLGDPPSAGLARRARSTRTPAAGRSPWWRRPCARGAVPAASSGVTGLLVSTPYIRDALDRGVLDRLPMFDRITEDGVAWDRGRAEGRFVPADVILWATGFRAALGHLAPLHLRGPGGGIRMDGTHVAGEPRVHLVGYGPSASTIGANRAGQAAARQLRRLLRPQGELPRTA